MMKTCPNCKGTNVAEIMYGLPTQEFLDELKKEWDNYIEEQSVVARALKTATTHFDYLEGRRRKALDRKFNAVKDLETQLDKNPDKALDVSIIENDVEDEQEFKSKEEERNQRQMTLDN